MKKNRLTFVNIFLVVIFILSAASSVILESLGGRESSAVSNSILVIMHITLTLTLFGMAYEHIRLHFGPVGKWPERLRKTKRQNRWLLSLALVTLATGIVAIATYFTHGHTPLGGIHGKIGFIASILMLFHLIHRRKWFKTLR